MCIVYVAFGSCLVGGVCVLRVRACGVIVECASRVLCCSVLCCVVLCVDVGAGVGVRACVCVCVCVCGVASVCVCGAAWHAGGSARLRVYIRDVSGCTSNTPGR